MATTTYDFPNIIRRTEDFSSREKQALVSTLSAAVGKVALVTADEVVVSTTTLTNSSCRVNGLKAGKLYLVRALAQMTNATAAGGAKAALDLTNTQTSAVFAGTQTCVHAMTATVTQIPATAGPTAGAAGGVHVTALADASAIGASTSGTGSAVQVLFEGFIQPQNDGDLVLQTASASGSTAQTLKAGSYLQVLPLNPARSQ